MMHDLHHPLKIERLIHVEQIAIVDRVKRPRLNTVSNAPSTYIEDRVLD